MGDNGDGTGQKYQKWDALADGDWGLGFPIPPSCNLRGSCLPWRPLCWFPMVVGEKVLHITIRHGYGCWSPGWYRLVKVTFRIALEPVPGSLFLLLLWLWLSAAGTCGYPGYLNIFDICAYFWYTFDAKIFLWDPFEIAQLPRKPWCLQGPSMLCWWPTLRWGWVAGAWPFICTIVDAKTTMII